MSRFFRVSTDYLLKDELERPEKIDGPTPPPQPIPSDEVPSDPRPLRRVSREPPAQSWVIWTVAGVLFGAVMTVMRLLNRKK